MCAGEIRAISPLLRPRSKRRRSPRSTQTRSRRRNRRRARDCRRACAQCLGSLSRAIAPLSDVDPPAREIASLRRYLDGTQPLPDGRMLYGALTFVATKLRAGDRVLEHRLSHDESHQRRPPRHAIGNAREALAAQGLPPGKRNGCRASIQRSCNSIRARRRAKGVTLRERAPFYAALALAFVCGALCSRSRNMFCEWRDRGEIEQILDTLLTSVSRCRC